MAGINELSPLEKRQLVTDQQDRDRKNRNAHRRLQRQLSYASRRGNIDATAGLIKAYDDAAADGVDTLTPNYNETRNAAIDTLRNAGAVAKDTQKVIAGATAPGPVTGISTPQPAAPATGTQISGQPAPATIVPQTPQVQIPTPATATGAPSPASGTPAASVTRTPQAPSTPPQAPGDVAAQAAQNAARPEAPPQQPTAPTPVPTLTDWKINGQRQVLLKDGRYVPEDSDEGKQQLMFSKLEEAYQKADLPGLRRFLEKHEGRNAEVTISPSQASPANVSKPVEGPSNLSDLEKNLLYGEESQASPEPEEEREFMGVKLGSRTVTREAAESAGITAEKFLKMAAQKAPKRTHIPGTRIPIDLAWTKAPVNGPDYIKLIQAKLRGE